MTLRAYDTKGGMLESAGLRLNSMAPKQPVLRAPLHNLAQTDKQLAATGMDATSRLWDSSTTIAA